MKRLASVAQGLLFAAYPFLIYAAHTRLPTRGVAVGLLLLLAAAAATRLAARAGGRAATAAAIARTYLPLAVLVLGAVALDSRPLLLLLPAVASAYLCAQFGWSLHRGPPMIERFARAIESDLPDFTAPYCRVVTAIWCGFLGANAAAIAVLAFWAPIGWWALYTGVVFYVLLASVAVCEYVVRKLWFRYYGSGPIDRVLARWFPPEATANGRRSLAYVARRRAASASPQ